jgi:hypothetical protein
MYLQSQKAFHLSDTKSAHFPWSAARRCHDFLPDHGSSICAPSRRVFAPRRGIAIIDSKKHCKKIWKETQFASRLKKRPYVLNRYDGLATEKPLEWIFPVLTTFSELSEKTAQYSNQQIDTWINLHSSINRSRKCSVPSASFDLSSE